ncbi:MAG: (d)CMP kinase [Bdellovibrionota bacterium]
MNKKLIVAIDGPAGSGKSTVTHLVARRLGYLHIDTGALYRAIALRAQEQGVGIEQAQRLGELALQSKLEFQWLEDRNQVFLDGRNVSSLIRTPEMSMAASKISAHPEVRAALLGVQRDMGKNGGVVLEGRDIGTVVFPNAHVKFYLNATVDSRARRRMVELEEKGIFLDFEEVKKQVVERDRGDMERKAAPLRKAEDAIEVDTTSMTVEQVVDALTSIVLEKQRQG